MKKGSPPGLPFFAPLGKLLVLQTGYAPQAYFSNAGKVGKSAPGTPRPPLFVQSVCIGFDTGQPLKYCKAAGLLVIGAVGYGLRLTALGLKAVSFLLGETGAPLK